MTLDWWEGEGVLCGLVSWEQILRVSGEPCPHFPLSLCPYKADLSCLLPLQLNSKGRLKATNWVIKISMLKGEWVWNPRE